MHLDTSGTSVLAKSNMGRRELENWVLKYFLSICRHQRLHYVISLLYHCTIFYPFDIVLELKPKLLAEQRGNPAGYSVDLPLFRLAIA
jgi:hypothetical protein